MESMKKKNKIRTKKTLKQRQTNSLRNHVDSNNKDSNKFETTLSLCKQ